VIGSAENYAYFATTLSFAEGTKVYHSDLFLWALNELFNRNPALVSQGWTKNQVKILHFDAKRDLL
jgi:hypothetical protein